MVDSEINTHNIDYYGKALSIIVIYIVILASLIIILDEIINLSIFTYNYTYNYNYGNINENICKSDDKTSILEYEKSRFRIFSFINNFKLKKDLFNKNWINYLCYIVVICLTILIFISFATIFYFMFIEPYKDSNCSFDIKKIPEDNQGFFKLTFECLSNFGNFIPNCSFNYFVVFMLIIIYPIIFLFKAFLKVDFTWYGGFWSSWFHLIFSLILLYYIIYLFRLPSEETSFTKVVFFTSFVVIFYIAQYIFEYIHNDYYNEFKIANIYNSEKDKNDSMFFDIYKQEEPIKPTLTLDIPYDANNSNLLVSFRYKSKAEQDTLRTSGDPNKILKTYQENLQKINDYYKRKQDNEERLKIYNNKYLIYKNNFVKFPEIVGIFDTMLPKLFGVDKYIILFVIIAIIIFVFIYIIFSVLRSNSQSDLN